MSILVLQIPLRPRLRAQDAAAAVRPRAEFDWVLSRDGVSPQSQGTSAPALFPKADTVIAVLADSDVAWHRAVLPKAPAARLRAALSGVLEDHLLDEPEAVHLALAPQPVAGQPTWIAAVDLAWLRGQLAAMEAGGTLVDRVVPASWPDDPPTGHFAVPSADDSDGGLVLHWSHAEGVASLPLVGAGGRALLPQPEPAGTRWSATPASAAAAGQWLGRPVAVLSAAERLLLSARTLWNLRQFTLASRSRGRRALVDALRQWRSPAWRPARWGVAALVIAQLVGLNLWAWHERSAIAERRQAMAALLQSSFPNVRSVLDAPLQMQREAQALRVRAGQPAADDLEPMLQAVASAWPADRLPADGLRFEPGRLSLVVTGWSEAQRADFASRLRPAGWDAVSEADGRLNVARTGAPR